MRNPCRLAIGTLRVSRSRGETSSTALPDRLGRPTTSRRTPAASPERAGGLQAVPRLPSRECEIHAGWRSAPSACRDRAARLLQPLYRIVSADRRRSHGIHRPPRQNGRGAFRRCHDCRVVSAKSMQAGDRHPPRVAIARRDFFNRSTGSSRQTDNVHMGHLPSVGTASERTGSGTVARRIVPSAGRAILWCSRSCRIGSICRDMLLPRLRHTPPQHQQPT